LISAYKYIFSFLVRRQLPELQLTQPFLPAVSKVGLHEWLISLLAAQFGGEWVGDLGG
jgi:hypothetical protein